LQLSDRVLARAPGGGRLGRLLGASAFRLVIPRRAGIRLSILLVHVSR
jgi:hypothetical protein